MDAILQDHSEITGEGKTVGLCLDMPDDVQDSLDRILLYYKTAMMRPKFALSGDPLSLTADLVTRVQQTLPAPLKKDGDTFLNYMVRQIVDFCRERNTRNLSLNFTFERGDV